MQEVLSTKEVSQKLGISTRHIARLVEGGHITPAIKAPGKRGAYLFDPAEVEHYRVMRELQTVGKTKAHPLAKEMG